MKISDVVVTRYAEGDAVAFARPSHEIAWIRNREIMIVEVHTDAGATGRGYLWNTGAPNDFAALLLRRHLRDVVIGCDPLLTRDIWQRMAASLRAISRRGVGLHCISAIDFALWDLHGKLLGVPVATLLGGRRDRVPTYANLGHFLGPDDLAEKAADYVGQGHRALKLRCTSMALPQATETVRAVREAAGADVKILVDVNGSWTADIAIQQLRKWEPFDVYLLEEPVPPDDVPGYVQVRRRAGSTYIAGGEQHSGTPEIRELLERHAVDVLQPNASGLGGITEWLRVRSLAQAHGVRISPYDLQMIHIHMGAAFDDVMWLEYYFGDNPYWQALETLFRRPKLVAERSDDGVFLLPPDAPGLGLELDEAEAERRLVREP